MGLGRSIGNCCTIWHERPITKPMVRATLLTLLAVTTTACASTGAVPRPFPTPGDRPPTTSDTPPPQAPNAATEPVPTRAPATSSGDGYALAGTALSLRGAPYRNQGTDPSGFDCSGFVQYVVPAVRTGLAARGERAVPQRQEGSPRATGARRSRLLHDGRSGRVARRHFDRRRSVRPRTKRARRGPRRTVECDLLAHALRWRETHVVAGSAYDGGAPILRRMICWRRSSRFVGRAGLCSRGLMMAPAINAASSIVRSDADLPK